MCPIDKLKNLQLNFIKHELHPSPPCQDVIELTFTYIRSPPNTKYQLSFSFRSSVSSIAKFIITNRVNSIDFLRVKLEANGDPYFSGFANTYENTFCIPRNLELHYHKLNMP